MNKYTLTFVQQDLEKKYQNHRFSSTVPACKAINLMCFLVCIIRSIFSIVIEDYINVMIFIPLGLLVLAVHFIVILYKKNWIDIYLLLINHILMLYQVYTEFGYKPQEAFIFGQCMMVLHMVVILVSDFKYAAIQMFNNTIIKLLIASYFQSDISAQTYLYTVLLNLIILFPLQKTNKQYRLSFLYTSNNNSFDWMIPIIIDNPFALIVYDDDSLRFQIKISNLSQHNLFKISQTNEQNLNCLLRDFKIFGKPFETFILNRRRNHKKLYVNKHFEIINSKKRSEKFYIKYSEVLVTELTFIIIVDQREQNYSLIENKSQKLEKGINKFLPNMKRFLKNQLSLLNQEQNIQKIYQAKVNLMYILTKMSVHKNINVKKCAIVSKIKQLLKLYSKAYSKHIEFKFCKQLESVITLKKVFEEMFIILMTFIFKQNSQQKLGLTLCISYYFSEEFIDLIIHSENSSSLYFSLHRNYHFRRCLQLIGPSDNILFENGVISIRLYKDLTQINKLSSYYDHLKQ